MRSCNIGVEDNLERRDPDSEWVQKELTKEWFVRTVASAAETLFVSSSVSSHPRTVSLQDISRYLR